MPEALAVVVAAAGPVNATVAPAPPATGLIVPEMLNVGFVAVAVKLIPVMFAPLTVAAALVGLNVNPVWLGVIA